MSGLLWLGQKYELIKKLFKRYILNTDYEDNCNSMDDGN